jgi:hypothetical protein
MEWKDPITWIVIILLLAVTGGYGGRAAYRRYSDRPPARPRRALPSLEPEPFDRPTIPPLPPRGVTSDPDDTPTDPPSRSTGTADQRRLRAKR